MIDCESDSNRVQVAMSLRGHTLKSGSKYLVGLDPNWNWADNASWTRRVDGSQGLEPTSTRYISRGVGCLRKTVFPLSCVENPSPIQFNRRTGPSSPPPELLLARVDTGRGAVRSALRRSRDWIGWIGSRDCTASRRRIDNPQLRV